MKHIFSKATLPGWALLVASQLRWLYAFVDAWSNVEFISEKVRSIRLLAVPIGLFASAWFQVALILLGLGWIALATSGWPQYLRRFRPRRRAAGAESEEEVVYFIRRSLADQIADMHRERKAEPFPLVQNDRGTREYSRREVDNLTPTQRERLFAADPEMRLATHAIGTPVSGLRVRRRPFMPS